MNASMGTIAGLIGRWRSAGVAAGDSEELRLQKSLLILATGLVSFASIFWLFIYWQLGPRFPTTVPLLFQALLVANLLVYFRSSDFDRFRRIQLALFLFMPFVTQWSMGNFISASGVSLWALLAPVGAVLCIGASEALAWFFAYLFLTAVSGGTDYYLGDATAAPIRVPTPTAVFFFALNFAAVSTIVFLLLRFAATEKEKIAARLKDAHARLQSEQERSEQLLLNILPGPVAERLKNSRQPIADGFADVSVMFVDIVNFTRVAATLDPQAVFALLNRIFSSFDELAEKFGLEKIKTIGDAYMVAGGLTDPPGDRDHSAALVDLALAMRDLLKRDFEVNALRLEVRIGIGTGAVVAGVVGKKKFIYDLWGDTVNIASRITGEGMPGMIQVDEATFLKLRARFDFEPAQTIHLKGKGRTLVYRVIGRKPQKEPANIRPKKHIVMHRAESGVRCDLPLSYRGGSGMRARQSGFTLVEIAIVLVIIGLLLGGVLKGQELVNSAKAKNLANDFRAVSSFVYAYQDRFRAMPGDDAAANVHVNGGINATSPAGTIGNARINGAWDSNTSSDESYLFWQHVRLAGLATGNPVPGSADYLPRNAEGGVIGITSDAVLSPGNPLAPYAAAFYVCSQGLLGRYVRQIDTMMDDGNSTTGSLRAFTDGLAMPQASVLVAPANDATPYTLCMAF